MTVTSMLMLQTSVCLPWSVEEPCMTVTQPHMQHEWQCYTQNVMHILLNITAT